MRKKLKYLGPKLCVDMAMMKPMMPTPNDRTMCQKRSPVRSECAETRKATMAAKAKGGAQRRSDTVRSYPRVDVSCGKNLRQDSVSVSS